MTNTMVCAIFTPTSSLLHSSSSTSCGKPILCVFSSSAVSIPKNAIFHHVKCIPQLGLTPFSQWNGLKHMGVSILQYSVKMERKGKFKGKGVYASLFGVGAPEALVIGVVALLVFGPKGLAEVARNLGKTLRAFQPTIRELQEVSREFKSTLEREIGLDETDNRVPKPSNTNTTVPKAEDKADDSGTNTESNGIPSETEEDPNEASLKLTEAKLRGVLAQLQKEQAEEAARAQLQSESQTPQDSAQAMDEPQEASSETTLTENSRNDTLQEATSAVPAAPSPPMPESEP